MIQELPKELRENYVVRYRHHRYTVDGFILPERDIRDLKKMMAPRGGHTEALLVDKTKHEVVERATSHCCPLDNFNKHIGRAIALGRLLQKI